jgi:hypothetical protein
MRSALAPTTAACLAAAWLVGLAVDSVPVVALVTVAALATPVLLAPRRRTQALWFGAVTIATAIAAILLLTAVVPHGGATLLVMVGGALVAAAVLPLVYAATFDDDPSGPS